ncbi:MAG: Fic family protein [Pseudomonadota bacterium]
MNSPGHFLAGLDTDLRENLLQQLKIEWTHHSTGLEGNTLSLGETAYVLTEGLTVDGKPLKDHNEVIGHGRAVDWVVSFASGNKNSITFDDLFALYKLVQTDVVLDIYRPYGVWKQEPNGTTGRDAQGRVQFIEFSAPADVPFLMEKWVAAFNATIQHVTSEATAAQVFADLHTTLTSIHPFWDGNGRMARLLANIPLLRSGLPPVVIQRTYKIREQYIGILQEMQSMSGVFSRQNAPVPLEKQRLLPLIKFCLQQWQHTTQLVQQAYDQQKKRSKYWHAEAK